MHRQRLYISYLTPRLYPLLYSIIDAFESVGVWGRKESIAKNEDV